MEKLRDFVVHPSIHSSLERWLEGIRKVQARRKEEIVNAANRHKNGGPRQHDEKGLHLDNKRKIGKTSCDTCNLLEVCWINNKADPISILSHISMFLS